MPFIDLSAMKEPFFIVKVGPPGAKPSDMVELPPYISKLIRSYELTEVIDGGKDSASRIRLVIDEDQNKPGSILDLRFDKKTGTIFKTEDEVSKSKQEITKQQQQDFETNINAQDALVDNNTKRSRNTNLQTLRDSKKKSSLFLFQERNIIEITWGYRNYSNINELSPRTTRGEILQITHKAAESDIPMTEILATDFGSGEMSKLYPTTGINFTREETKNILKKVRLTLLDDSLRKDTEHARIDDIVRAIAYGLLNNTEANIDLTPEELTLDLKDSTVSRSWSKYLNLHSFLKHLAESIFAHYYVTTKINKEGKLVTVLNLVSRRKHENGFNMHFMWKSGLGTNKTETATSTTVFNTIKNFALAIYPDGGSGASSDGVCSKTKKIIGHSTQTEIAWKSPKMSEAKDISIRDKESEKLNDKDPDLAASLGTQGVSSYGESCLETDHISKADRIAGRMERGLKIDYTTIGIPQLRPSVIKMSNIGLRYSGLYHILSVTHKIDVDSGYTCSCTGESNVVASGGVSLSGPKVKNKLADKFTKIRWLADPSVGPRPIKIEE